MSDGKILHEQEIDWGKARETIRRGIRYRLGVAESPDLEDLTQESVIRLLRAVRREGATNTSALIAVIVGRVVAQYLRSQTRRRLRFKPLESETVDALDADFRYAPDHFGDPLERLELIVIEVFHRYRSSCIELARFYFLSRDWKSVAEELGVPHDAVRARWKRCVELLRKVIRADSSEGLLSRWAEGY
ncbi:MAG: sigma-70 family RNA polymerase sigma factor [Candidatus Eisenbacteria bacterium]|nr:sigma-70 family RNA polymerase sigma factor [Candidatus Eisenbacteria bacterium]